MRGSGRLWVGRGDALREGRGCRSGIWGAGEAGLGSELGFGAQCWGLRGKGGVGCNPGGRLGFWGAGEGLGCKQTLGCRGKFGVQGEIWGAHPGCRGRFGVHRETWGAREDLGCRPRTRGSGVGLGCSPEVQGEIWGLGGDLGVQKEIWGAHLRVQVPFPFQMPGSATWQLWPWPRWPPAEEFQPKHAPFCQKR